MTISATGLAYLTMFISMFFLTFRLFQYWKEERDLTSKLFVLFGISVSAFLLVRSFSCLFFINNNNILLISIYVVAFIQAIAAAVVGYLFSYLKLPKLSPWILSGVMLAFGIAVFFLALNAKYQVYVGEWGTANFGYPTDAMGMAYSLMRAVLLSFVFFPVAIILLGQMKQAESKILKERCFGLTIVLLGGMIAGIMDFILVGLLGLPLLYRDITVFSLGIILTVIILLTQKSPSSYTQRYNNPWQIIKLRKFQPEKSWIQEVSRQWRQRF
jgi:hypothetical protein